MTTLITTVHIITCLLLILVVLIQSGKGAEISASFAGSSQTIFGSSGGANFFTKFTAAMAGVFMLTSLTLTIMGNPKTLMKPEASAPASAPVSAPAQSNNTSPTSTAPATTAPAAPAAKK